MAEVGLERVGEVALIEIDNPPVNALSETVRIGLAARIAEAMADDAGKAAVIACAGRTFIAGADINELGKPRQPPLTVDIAAQLDDCAKPVVAAIHGTALGGGLELALACHWRVAAPDARLGLPEVKLGIVPGGGGTQRLPRAIGVKLALDMITSGEMIGASAALDAGLVDEIVTRSDVRSSAIALARRVVAEKRPIKRLRDRAIEPVPAELFTRARAELARRRRGFEAPLKAVDAVAAAIMRFDDGLKREQTIFAELLRGPQFETLRHVFFAEREAAKAPDLPADLKPREIAHAAVIGTGTMGGGIALSFADVGIPVTLIDTDRAALERGLAMLRRNFESSARRRNLPAAELDRRLGLIKPSLRLVDAAGADLVIEAVFEELDVKRTVFGKLDGIAKAGAILATNTSFLDVDAIAEATKRPQDVLGLHFFSPVHAMRLVEVVRTRATSPDVLATALALMRRLASCRWWSVRRRASWATACCSSARARPTGCCATAFHRPRSITRWSSSAFRWGPLRRRIWLASTCRGAYARRAASRCRYPTRCARPAASGRRRARAITATRPAAASRWPTTRPTGLSPRCGRGSASRRNRSPPARSSSGWSIR